MDTGRARTGISPKGAHNVARADAFALEIAERVEVLRETGIVRLADQAVALNRRGVHRRHGRRRFSTQQLYVVLRRARGLLGRPKIRSCDVVKALRSDWLWGVQGVVIGYLERGDVSQAELAAMLNRQGLRTFTGQLWRQRSVSRLLAELRSMRGMGF